MGFFVEKMLCVEQNVLRTIDDGVEEGSFVQGENVLIPVFNPILESIGRTLSASIGPTRDDRSMLMR